MTDNQFVKGCLAMVAKMLRLCIGNGSVVTTDYSCHGSQIMKVVVIHSSNLTNNSTFEISSSPVSGSVTCLLILLSIAMMVMLFLMIRYLREHHSDSIVLRPSELYIDLWSWICFPAPWRYRKRSATGSRHRPPAVRVSSTLLVPYVVACQDESKRADVDRAHKKTRGKVATATTRDFGQMVNLPPPPMLRYTIVTELESIHLLNVRTKQAATGNSTAAIKPKTVSDLSMMESNQQVCSLV